MAGKSRLLFGRSGSILNLPISLSGCSGIPMLNHRLRAASAPEQTLGLLRAGIAPGYRRGERDGEIRVSLGMSGVQAGCVLRDGGGR